MNIEQGVSAKIDSSQFDLSEVHVGLGWDMRLKEQGGILQKLRRGRKKDEFDLDLTAFLLNEKGKIGSLGTNKEVKRGQKVPLVGSDIIHFNNLKLADRTVWHSGDNPNGAGSGDDERIILNLDQLAPRYHQILFFVTIFEGSTRNQHFDLIENAFIRALDAQDQEIFRYNLSNEDAYKKKSAMLFARIFRSKEGWCFEAIGKGYQTDSFVELMREYIDFDA